MIESLNIGNNSTLYIGKIAEVLDSVLPHTRVVVITDVNINKLYPDLVHSYDHIVIGSGEAIKNLNTVSMIYNRLMAMGADRSTFILGIGGGIVTDIAGFVAATYMRGLDFGFISTTLLGQVDASIGGKNGVNVADYKNMAGTFRHPRFVISDVEMLHSLPQRELRAGMAEAVKSALVGDAALFDFIEEHADGDLYSNAAALQHIVEASVAVKSNIVADDELEKGRRRMLNLGHTLGHAIEKCTHDVNHGEAVAMGISLIAHASMKQGFIKDTMVKRIDDVLTRLGFKLTPPTSIANVLREVKYDKKKKDNLLHLVMLEGVGSCRIVDVSFEELDKLFE